MLLKRLLPAAVCSIALLGCEKKGAAPAAAPRAVEVGIVHVDKIPIEVTSELPGRTLAYRLAQVRARVNGIVLKRVFTEGAEVKQGDLLFQIDPAPYQAAYDSAQAAVARAEANLKSIKLQEERARELLEVRGVSQQEYDNVLAALQVAEADVTVAKAASRTAAIDLGYTSVTSPIDGRIGLTEVTEGAYVQAGQATLLATVQQIDPIYVDIVQSSVQIARLDRELANGRLTRANAGERRVRIFTENGLPYPHEGSVRSADISVDRSTGSVTLRAVVPNPEGTLRPGMFVRTMVVEGVQSEALVVLQQGVTRNYRGDPTAYVVAENGTAELRTIQTGRTHGDQWTIESGLNFGDQVIVSNLQRIRPGVPVKPVPFEPPAAAAQAAPVAH